MAKKKYPKPVQYAEAFDLKLKVGDLIMKKNFTEFGSRANKTAVLEITKVQRHPKWQNHAWNKGGVKLNGVFEILQDDVEVLTPERAKEIQAIYEDFKISESTKPELNTSCVREDNGKPKEALSESAAKKVLYRYRMLNPTGGYEVYKCTHCKELHLGKTLNAPLANTLQV